MTTECTTCQLRPHGRGLCGACYSRASRAGALADHERATRTWPDLEDDLLILLGRTADVHAISTTLGMTPAAIARAAYRHGRADLGRPFGAAAKRKAA